MAISGSLKDVKFVEILKIVGKRTGRLWIYNFDTNVYQEWFVHQNMVHAVRVNRISQAALQDVHQAAFMLNADGSSSYIFYNQDVDRVPIEISIPITSIAVKLFAENLDFEIYREQLPNPETRFAAIENLKTELTGELKDFFDFCNAHLENQFTAREAAVGLNINLEVAQFNVYKLRAAGIIRPVRVNSFVQSEAPLAALTDNYQLSNDANAPRSPSLRLESVSPSVIPPKIVDETPAQPVASKKRLVQRMLEAFSFGRKSN